jgi:hypothetical protein
MIENNAIKNAIRSLANTNEAIYSVICTIAEIDEDSNTCTCSPIDGVSADLLDVKLIAQESNGFIIYPKIDSQVIVTFLNKQSGYVSMCSEIDKIYLNGKNFNGLVKIDDLVTKLNDLENKVNALVAYSASHTHPVSGPLAGPTTTPVTGSLTPTVRGDLENTTVSHGDGS